MKRTKVISRRADAVATYHFDDYPPGTPAPDMPSLDMSDLNPLLRAWAKRRLKRMELRRKATFEAARDEYYRRKESNGDASSA